MSAGSADDCNWLSGLPDAALAAVCTGRLSSWAASRVVAPLARANSEHADQFPGRLLSIPTAWVDPFP
jgi:hypothetical protein